MGAGDRGRNNRPEITEPVMSGRFLLNNRITCVEMAGYRPPKTAPKNRLKTRKTVPVPNTGPHTMCDTKHPRGVLRCRIWVIKLSGPSRHPYRAESCIHIFARHELYSYLCPA